MLNKIKNNLKKQNEINELIEEMYEKPLDKTDEIENALMNDEEDEFIKNNIKNDQVDLSVKDADVLNEKEPKTKCGGKNE